ncbi:hypothetical protein M1E17_00270 [Arthrobacter sp. D1-29]
MEFLLLTVGPFLFWGALLVAAVAGTVFAVRRHAMLQADGTSDTMFWDVFMGSVVAVPAILIPALESPLSGLLLSVVGGAAGIASYRYSPRVLAWQQLRRQRRLDQPVHQAAQAQHEELLARWRRYELDPALCIDYPAITDVRMPETSALIRAMRDAEELRAVRHEGYPPAVTRLVQALAAAEKAAGIPANGH